MSGYASAGFDPVAARSWVRAACLAPHPTAAFEFHLAGRTGDDYVQIRTAVAQHATALGGWSRSTDERLGQQCVDWLLSSVPADAVGRYLEAGIRCDEAVDAWEPVRVNDADHWADALVILLALQAAEAA